MSLNKTLLIGLAAVIFIGAIFLVNHRNSKDKLAEEAISPLKSASDHSHDCEAFEKLQKLASDSKLANYFLGQMYARGTCHPFDLQLALDSFRKSNLSPEKFGAELFDCAMWELNPQSSLTSAQMTLLLKKSKDLGFTPNQQDLEKLPKEFSAIFKSP